MGQVAIRWRLAGLAMGMVLLATLYAAAAPVRPGDELTDEPGTIVAVNVEAGWYGIVPDSDQSIRFAPDGLPEAFRKDGLQVVFSGRVEEIPPNVRTWGRPLTLTKIRKVE